MKTLTWLISALVFLPIACGGSSGSPPSLPTAACTGSGLINDPTHPPACDVPPPWGSTCPGGISTLVINPSSTLYTRPGWWEGEIAAARDPKSERSFVATVSGVPAAHPTLGRCLLEKAISVYQSDGSGSWSLIPGNDKLPRPVALTGAILPATDPFADGVVATDPWLDVGRNGELFFSMVVIPGSKDCSHDWPTFTTGFKAGKDIASTPENEGERLEEMQLWVLPNTPGAQLTKIALDPNGATAVDGAKTSEISKGTVNLSMDHPRMAVSPARDQVVYTFLAQNSPQNTAKDRLRTIMKQTDGTWKVVPTRLEELPGSFTFPMVTFDPDGNLYVAFSNATDGLRVMKYAWTADNWELRQDVTVGMPAGTTNLEGRSTAFWQLPNSAVALPVDATPALAIDRIGGAQQAILYVAYTVWQKGADDTKNSDDQPRVVMSAVNVKDIGKANWMPPKLVSTTTAFSPSLSFSGKANVVDVLHHEVDPALTDPPVGMRQHRFWASDFGREQTASLAVGAPIGVKEMAVRSPRTAYQVFYGEYQGLAGMGRVSVTAVPTRVASGDTDLFIATIKDICSHTVREISSGSHPDHVWECDCSCGGSLTNRVGCLPSTTTTTAAACAKVCLGSDCGQSLSCLPSRQCAPTGKGQIKLGNACQSTYGPWIGPPPSLFADYYADATAASQAHFVLDGDGASTALGGSVSLNVSAIPPAAGARIEISRLDLRPASFGVGGFLGATVRDIRIVHVERFYGTFTDSQHFTIPAHTAELVARIAIDPDGPSWLTGDTRTVSLGIDNDAPITGTLDLASQTVSLTIAAGGGSNSVNATFVGGLKAAPIDSDGDGIVDAIDNCPFLYNPDQVDAPPVFGPVPAIVATRCSPADTVDLPFPAASDACTPKEVSVEGEIVAVDGKPLSTPIVVGKTGTSAPDGLLEVKWTATDGNGHVATVSQSIELTTVPTLQAAGDLRLSDRVDVLAPGGQYGSLMNAGTGDTELGTDTDAGDLLTHTSIFLRERATVHGVLKAPAPPSTQNNVTIGQLQVPATPYLPAMPVLNVTFPGGPDVVRNPDTPAIDVIPGSYGWVKVERNSGIRLVAGTYRFNAFQLEPGSHVVLDKSQGPIQIHVRDNLILRGTFEPTNGDFAGFLLGFAGTNDVYMDRPFAGKLFAPLAKLTLSTVQPNRFRGLFRAKHIEVMPDTVVEHVPYDCVPSIVNR